MACAWVHGCAHARCKERLRVRGGRRAARRREGRRFKRLLTLRSFWWCLCLLPFVTCATQPLNWKKNNKNVRRKCVYFTSGGAGGGGEVCLLISGGRLNQLPDAPANRSLDEDTLVPPLVPGRTPSQCGASSDAGCIGFLFEIFLWVEKRCALTWPSVEAVSASASLAFSLSSSASIREIVLACSSSICVGGGERGRERERNEWGETLLD